MKKVWPSMSEHKMYCEIELQINNGSFFSINIYINAYMVVYVGAYLY